MIVHRQVWLGPIACDAKTLEFFALDIHPFIRKGAAFAAELDHGYGIFVLALFAVLFLDFPFDWQTVTVPAGHVSRVKAHHLMAADDHILDGFVQRVADMQVAVRIGRAVVQRKRGPALFFAQAVVNANFFPTFQPGRFTFRKPRTHRKVGFRQVQGVFVIWCGRVRAHLEIFLGRGGSNYLGLRQAKIPVALTSERRANNSQNDASLMEHVPLIGGGAVTVNPRYPVRIENDPPCSPCCTAAWEHLDEFHPVFGASLSYVQLWVARGRQTAAKVELYAIWMKKNRSQTQTRRL